jgi:hypothetical protein
MPSFCDYRNCQNLASSSFGGFCSLYHFKRGQILVKRQQIAKLETEIKQLEEQIRTDELQDRKRFG